MEKLKKLRKLDFVKSLHFLFVQTRLFPFVTHINTNANTSTRTPFDGFSWSLKGARFHVGRQKQSEDFPPKESQM